MQCRMPRSRCPCLPDWARPRGARGDGEENRENAMLTPPRSGAARGGGRDAEIGSETVEAAMLTPPRSGAARGGREGR